MITMMNVPAEVPQDFNAAAAPSPTSKTMSFRKCFTQRSHPKRSVSYTLSGRLMLDNETLSCTAPKELWKKVFISSMACQLKRKVDIELEKSNENETKIGNQYRLSLSNEALANKCIVNNDETDHNRQIYELQPPPFVNRSKSICDVSELNEMEKCHINWRVGGLLAANK